ncbi:MAG: hypothetical protein RMY64_35900 [Nostoc sp. DedQUE08]|uniref:hypothetical protein n=1 Tax=unclassified Nostoc TaxID=2593658 RepID=UPI002AD3469E|nr:MULTISPECIES: hypothetical protein [unclassified Nostoc]MDZ8070944.1 hypothetical protein [Nostoc sp. DedQUE08]MDZ8139881.1 hypothetical protein [Nostoc sp. DedQUE04]
MTLLELTANLIWVYIPLTRSYLHFGCDRSNYGSLLDRRDRIHVMYWLTDFITQPLYW